MLRSSLPIIALRALLAASSFTFNVLLARLLIDTYGATEYGSLSLILAIPALIPFADLGMGTSVVNSAADLRNESETMSAAARIRSAQLVLMIMGIVVASLAILAGLTDAWPLLLGPAVSLAPFYSLGATAVGIATALGVILSVGVRTMQGWRKIALTVLISLGTAPAALGLTWLLIQLGVPAGLAVTSSAVALLLTNCAYVMYVLITGRRYVNTVRNAKITSGAVRYVLNIGLSGLVVSVSAAVLLQSDRILVSFRGTPEQLTQYAVAVPLYLAAWAFLTPLALNLWPLFRSRQQRGEMKPSTLFSAVAIIGSVGLLGAFTLVVFGPSVSSLMSNGAIAPPPQLFLAFALLLWLQSIQYPASMVLSSRRGFKWQRNVAAVMIPVKLSVGLLLVAPLGGTGAIIASIITVAAIQLPFTYLPAIRAIRTPLGWVD